MKCRLNSTIIFVINILCCIDLSVAQVDSTRKNGFSNYEPDDGIKKPKSKYSSSAVKVGIAAIFSGKYGVAIEQELGDMFSIEAGLGLTGRNFAGNLIAKAIQESQDYGDQESPNFDSDNDIWDEDYNFQSREAKLGWYFSLMPRMYFDQSGFEDGYLGLNFQYRSYNYEAYQPDPTANYYDSPEFDSSLPIIDEFENNLILGLTWGNQALNGNVVIDWFISGGINKVKAERRDIGQVTIPFTNNFYTVAGNLPRKISEVRPYFELGFQIGGWWE